MKGKKNISELIDRLRHSFTLLQVPLPQVRIAAVTDDGTMDPGALLTLLTDEERASAEARTDESERRHLVFRRAFQRLFVADLTGWTDTLPALTLRHATDTPPSCDQAPGLTLSFSSSGTTCLAAAAPDALLGVDIEARRQIADASGIATRFFTPAEADLVRETPPGRRSEIFQTIWCAKEAALKAKGRASSAASMPSQLNATKRDGLRVIRRMPDRVPGSCGILPACNGTLLQLCTGRTQIHARVEVTTSVIYQFLINWVWTDDSRCYCSVGVWSVARLACWSRGPSGFVSLPYAQGGFPEAAAGKEERATRCGGCKTCSASACQGC